MTDKPNVAYIKYSYIHIINSSKEIEATSDEGNLNKAISLIDS